VCGQSEKQKCVCKCVQKREGERERERQRERESMWVLRKYPAGVFGWLISDETVESPVRCLYWCLGIMERIVDLYMKINPNTQFLIHAFITKL